MKSLNQKVGALKRKLKMGKDDFEPGALIEKARQTNKEIKSNNDSLSKQEVAIRGMI